MHMYIQYCSYKILLAFKKYFNTAFDIEQNIDNTDTGALLTLK